MPQSNQGQTARRFQEFQHIPLASARYDAGYECELPPDARSEFVRPRRPVMLEPPRVERKVDRSGLLLWAGAFALVAIILAGVIGHYSGAHKAPATPRPDPVLEHSRQILEQHEQSTQPVSQPPAPPVPAVSAPRARLVLYKRWAGNGVWEITDSTGRTVRILVDPAPRAQLVQLPEWQPGTELNNAYALRRELRGPRCA